jgi:hypothetical protein
MPDARAARRELLDRFGADLRVLDRAIAGERSGEDPSRPG